MEGYVLDSDEPLIIPLQFDEYETLEIIGQGAFSVVTQVRNIKNNGIYACKVVPRYLFTDKYDLIRLEHELRIYEQIHHQGIAKHEKTIFTEKFIFVVMEYCPNGTLFQHIKRFKKLSEIEIYRYLHIIISALQYLHSKGIAHRDIKLENIVFSQDYVPKLIDFGLSVQTLHPKKQGSALRETICGSLNYIAPEVLVGGMHDVYAADVWALGICTYAMCVGEFPFFGSSENDISRMILGSEVNLPSSISPVLRNAIQGMLTKDPAKRLTLDKIKEMIPISLAFAHSEQNKNAYSQGAIRFSTTIGSLNRTRKMMKKPNYLKIRPNGAQSFLSPKPKQKTYF